MQMRRSSMALAAGLLVLGMSAQADTDNRLGVGARYWTNVKNIDVHNVDKNGFSWMAGYQYWPTLIGVDVEVEWLQSGYAGATTDVFLPQAYLLVGRTIYGAVGIGGYYSDGEWGDNPFYAFRAGLNLELIPHFYLDINANYRFEDWSGLKGSDINSDTITLGASAWLAF